MSQQKLLIDVAVALRALGVEFMLSGSHASSLQGQARATHDIDLVACVTLADVKPLLGAFSSERFYISEVAVREAIRTKRMFNLLETTTGEKVDFWVLSDSPFDRSRFDRRRPIEIAGETLDVSSPEDTILMKLVWCKLSGGSEKQFGDALRIYEVQAGALDVDYVRTWLAPLDVEDLWRRIESEGEPFSTEIPTEI